MAFPQLRVTLALLLLPLLVAETMTRAEARSATGENLDVQKRQVARCPTEEVRLSNGECVWEDWVCDTVVQAEIDEENCPTDCSGENQFLCTDGTCIPKWRDCDGEPQCPDASDEAGCTTRPCGTMYTKCDTGLCIYTSSLCNGWDDCGNGWDELDENCPS